MDMNKLKLNGRNLGRVFNSRSGGINAIHPLIITAMWPD
jgi:hypothetical protein